MTILSGGRTTALLVSAGLLASLAACGQPDPEDSTPPEVRLVANSGDGPVTLTTDNGEDHPDPLPLNLTLDLAASASDTGGMSVAALGSTVRWECVDGTEGEKVIGPDSSRAVSYADGRVGSALAVSLGISADAAGLGCRSQDTLKRFSIDASLTATNAAGLKTKLARHWRYVGPPDLTIVPYDAYDGPDFLGTVEQAQTWCGSLTPPNPPCLNVNIAAYEALIESGWLLTVESVIFDSRDRSVIAGTPFDILFTIKNSGRMDSPADAQITWYVYPGMGNHLGNLLMQRSLTLGTVVANPDIQTFLVLRFGPLNAGTYTLRAIIDPTTRLGGTVFQGAEVFVVVDP